MAVVLAQDFKLAVGAGYDTISDQRDGTMTLAHAVVDTTNKDDALNRSLLAGVHSWSFNCSGLIEETTAGFMALWTAWDTKVTLAGRFTTPKPHTYTGTTYISNLTYGGPYNDVFVYNLNCEGTAALLRG